MKDFVFMLIRLAMGPTQPPTQWLNCALSSEEKRPELEDDHSPPRNAEVKKMWTYTSTPSYFFMAQCLIG
jgi:hypothetical protein